MVKGGNQITRNRGIFVKKFEFAKWKTDELKNVEIS